MQGKRKVYERANEIYHKPDLTAKTNNRETQKRSEGNKPTLKRKTSHSKTTILKGVIEKNGVPRWGVTPKLEPRRKDTPTQRILYGTALER